MNTIKHFILGVLASIFLLFTIFEVLGSTAILGYTYGYSKDTKYILYLIPVIIVGMVSFIISSKLFCHRTTEDKEKLEKLVYIDNRFENDAKTMSEDELRRKYEVVHYDL